MEDQEKMRKRQRERDQADANGQLMSKARSSDEGGSTFPSEEEVEEFFEILQRMHVAVRYFDKKINVDGERDGRFSGKLREALETGWVKVVTHTTAEGDQGNAHVPVEDAEAPKQMFDLNSEPDQEMVKQHNSKY